MKRIAALAALMITMLAVPTAAMASTGGSGWGSPGQVTAKPYGPPGQIQVACRLPVGFPKGIHKGQVTITAKARAYLFKKRHGKPVAVRINCPNLPVKPFPNGCKPQVLRFDMAAGSSTMTEVSGPTLAPPQEFTYQGSTYTIMSVNPGADSFTVFKDGWLFVNSGADITNAIGFMACSH
jgi:hypothetical protein